MINHIYKPVNVLYRNDYQSVDLSWPEMLTFLSKLFYAVIPNMKPNKDCQAVYTFGGFIISVIYVCLNKLQR